MLSLFGISATNLPRPLHIVEFKTHLLKIANNLNETTQNCIDALHVMLETPDFFTDTADGYRLLLNYPNHPRDKLFKIKVNKELHELRIYDDNRLFVTMKVNAASVDIFHTSLRTKMGKFYKEAMFALVDSFNEVLQSKQLNYLTQNSAQVHANIYHKKGTYFKQSDFSALMQHYKMKEFNYRINQVIVKNSVKKDNKFTFHLNWQDVHGAHTWHHLRVTFERDTFKFSQNNDDYSWCFTEKVLLAHFPEYRVTSMQPEQYYYLMKVDERVKKPGKKKNAYQNVLNTWMTLDGEYGEIHDVHKGVHLSGNDVLDIYQYFDNLFQLKRAFICDESSLEEEEKPGEVPRKIICLRLIVAIVTGKTWYESKLPGLKLFDCCDFQTKSNGVITQNAAKRKEALLALQQWSIEAWLMLLPEESAERLLSLCQEASQMEGAHFVAENLACVTLQQLTAVIYHDAKVRHQITPALKALSYLLLIDPSRPDCLQDHTNELIEGSRFWVKYREDVPLIQSEPEKSKLVSFVENAISSLGLS